MQSASYLNVQHSMKMWTEACYIHCFHGGYQTIHRHQITHQNQLILSRKHDPESKQLPKHLCLKAVMYKNYISAVLYSVATCQVMPN